MGHPIQDDEETLSEVNVIPLADLSLVLLIILMVISPLVSQALIKVTAAQAAAAQTQEELSQPNPETPIIVSFDPMGIKLNGEVMPDELLFAGKLEGVLLKRRDRSVNFTAAPNVSHGDVVHVIDLIRRHGAQSLVMLKWDPQTAASAGATL